MKKITVIESRNGWLVVDGNAEGLEYANQLAGKSWTFNSLDAAIAQIRRVLRSWRETDQQEQTKNAEGES